jgi:hypothetical protein
MSDWFFIGIGILSGVLGSSAVVWMAAKRDQAIRNAIREEVLYEQESCIDIVEKFGGSAEIVAAIRARGER